MYSCQSPQQTPNHYYSLEKKTITGIYQSEIRTRGSK